MTLHALKLEPQLKQASKLIEYIDKKQQILAKTTSLLN